jgi:hypothetical protein
VQHRESARRTNYDARVVGALMTRASRREGFKTSGAGLSAATTR